MPNPLQLTREEARILGVLIEKQATVPDTYPLSLNALTAGCNQKTGRDPIMDLSEGAVLASLDALRGHDLVIESSGSRVARYSHNLGRVLQLPTPAVALIAMLMLRGAQTAAELRSHCERLYRFADVSSVEAFLEELADRGEGPITRMLPRMPGTRENRWVHLLCGEPDIPATTTGSGVASTPLAEEVASLRAEVAALRAEVAELRQLIV
ncbi:YceH family protein [Uliginosibacterium gangwonense]|uniref:YceH family protein n=1 Tax=Uliginosibacterium gangwonense TaxID=392736 RepID=UPI00036E7746|nr:YceH family protein [Uliginosibacterium gangwonense]